MPRPKGRRNRTPQERELAARAAASKVPNRKGGRPPKASTVPKVDVHSSSPSVTSEKSSSSSSSYTIKTWFERQIAHQRAVRQQSASLPPLPLGANATIPDPPPNPVPQLTADYRNPALSPKQPNQINDLRIGLEDLTSSSSAGSRTPATLTSAEIVQSQPPPIQSPAAGPGHLMPSSESSSSVGSPTPSNRSIRSDITDGMTPSFSKSIQV